MALDLKCSGASKLRLSCGIISHSELFHSVKS